MKEMSIYKEMLDTALNVGLPVISSDKCCRLLAYVYVYGGGNEAVVFNEKMNADIVYAQKRLNIVGGEIVNRELLPALQKYIKSLSNMFPLSKEQADKAREDFYNPPQWVIDLEKEYGIKKYRD